jgi:hypothetical protein
LFVSVVVLLEFVGLVVEGVGAGGLGANTGCGVGLGASIGVGNGLGGCGLGVAGAGVFVWLNRLFSPAAETDSVTKKNNKPNKRILILY